MVTLQVRAQELGIPYRDSALFSTENRATDQKAAILVRQVGEMHGRVLQVHMGISG
jgi:hypothetical protein